MLSVPSAVLVNPGGLARLALDTRWLRDNVLPLNRGGGFFPRGQRRAFERKEKPGLPIQRPVGVERFSRADSVVNAGW